MEDLMRENVGEAQNDELLTSLTIEETFEELDNLLDMLEQSDNSLEESFRYFERGMKLIKAVPPDRSGGKQILVLSGERA